jgi:PAS domain S-box-containing protein
MLYAIRSQRIEGVLLRLILPLLFLTNWLGLAGIGWWALQQSDKAEAKQVVYLAIAALVIAVLQIVIVAWFWIRQSDSQFSNPLRKLVTHSEAIVLYDNVAKQPELVLQGEASLDYLERLDQALLELSKLRRLQIDSEKRHSQYRDVLEARVERRTSSIEFERTAMSAILAHLRDGVLALNEKGIIKIANPAVLQLLGRSKDEVLGKSLTDFVRYAEEHTDEVLIAEAVAINKDGDQIPVDIARTRLKAGENDRFSTIVSLRDMSTQMAQAEGEQYQAFFSGAAESSMALLFNVNEATLSVYQEVLNLNSMLQPGSPEQNQLGKIQQSVNNIVNLMASQNDSLFLSSQSDEYQLRDVVKEAITIAKRQYPDAKVSFKVRWGEFDDRLFGPRSELLKVLVRLACDASESVQKQQQEDDSTDGEVRILLHRPTYEWIDLSIIDNGIGQDQQQLHGLFAAPRAENNNTAGSLYSMAVTLDNIGGRLSAASDGLGKGMRVNIKLPVKE